MKQYTFPKARGMTLNNLHPDISLCMLLKNFISDENGIYIRNGCKLIYEGKEEGLVASYYYGEVFLFLTKEAGKVIELPSDFNKKRVVLNNFPIGQVVDTLETNNRLIVFFDNNKSFEIYKKDDGEYSGEEISFIGSGKDIIYNGGTVYKNRVFYYQKGSSKIYYTQPLAYKGELKEYNIEGIFGARGRLHQVFTMGFNAGAQVTSYLLAIFDSGDILVFNGLNPEDPKNWQVVLKTSLNTAVYKKAVTVGTTAYILTDKGIVDLARVISTNSININEAIISNDFFNSYNGELGGGFWSNYSLKIFSNFMLAYTTHNDLPHYLYNFRTNGFSSIVGWEIDSLAVINNKVLFSKKNKVYQAFRGNSDCEQPIVAEYITSFTNLGNFMEKRTLNSLLTIKHNGKYQLYYDIHKNNVINKGLNTSVYLKNNSTVVHWSAFASRGWEAVKKYLWNGGGNNNFITHKFIRNKLGRTFAVKIKAICLRKEVELDEYSPEFVINDITINYETWGR